MDNHIHTDLCTKIPIFRQPFTAFVFGSERSGKTTMILSAIDHLIQNGVFRQAKVYRPKPAFLTHVVQKQREFQFNYPILPFDSIESIEPYDILLFTQETITTPDILEVYDKLDLLKAKINTNQCGVFICSEYPLIFLKFYPFMDILVFKRLNPRLVFDIKHQFENDHTKYWVFNSIFAQYYNGNGFKFKEKESVILSDTKNSHLDIHGLWKNI